jgi:hypothetical protein
MAWSASKIFMATIEDALENTTAFDANSDTFKAALYDNDITPDQTVASANTAYNAGQWTASGNEVANGGWASGGVALTSVTSSFSSNVYTFDAADTANGTAATLSNVYGCLVYDDTLTRRSPTRASATTTSAARSRSPAGRSRSCGTPRASSR